MNKIRVAHIVGNMNGGGVESFVMTMSSALKEYIEPTFICFNSSKKIPFEKINEIGGRVFVVPNFKKYLSFKNELTKIFLSNDFDIIHSHLNTLSFLPLRIAKKANYSIRIAHSHSTSNYRDSIRFFAKIVFRYFTRKYATVFMACGEAAARFQFGVKNVDKGNVILVHNAIDINSFKFNITDRNNIRAELGLPEKTIVAGNIGRFVPVKNHYFLLKIAKETPHITYIFIGDGKLDNKIKKAISKQGLSNVRIIPFSNSVSKYYSALDVLVMPSLYEGFSIVSLEAQANGLFCIFSNSVSRENLVSNNGKFLGIKKTNVKDWADAISNVKERYDNLSLLKKQGFDICDGSRVLLSIYKKLLFDFREIKA